MERRVTVISVALLLAGFMTACGKDSPDGALKTFVSSWERGDLNGLALLSPDGQRLNGDEAHKTLTTIEGDLAGHRPKLRFAKPVVKGDEARTRVKVSWPLADGVAWEYETVLSARRIGERWTVFFGPRTVHPDLVVGDRLALRRTVADRGGMLFGDGQPMVANRPVVVVGLEPQATPDVDKSVRQLDIVLRSISLPLDLSGVPGQVRAAKPDAFVEVVNLRKEDYTEIEKDIRAIPGSVTRSSTGSLAPSRRFARPLLGYVDDVTKEVMDKQPGKYRTGDQVGLAGLQQRYDDVLRGTPGYSVVVPAPQGAPDRRLFMSEPKPGGQVKTTLDARVQTAAEDALALDVRRSALVAIRVSDSAMLAVANGPGVAAQNFALTGQTAPGSTLKMVSTLALLDSGAVGPDTIVDCPRRLEVDGYQFRNSHDMELGPVPFRTSFAQSCNTSFVALAPKLGPDGLAGSARTLGIGVPWDLGADAFTGKVATGGSRTDQAAASFGQGTTLTSPVALAAAVAAVARGQWKQPTLILDPAPAKRAADGPPLRSESLDALRAMMREVVTAGTAQSLKGIPGELRGKTGTAEFTTDTVQTHSWFIGYRDDIAFCVFVENGGAGTDAAVPIAGKFLQGLG